MKIQSRPPIEINRSLSIDEIKTLFLQIIELEGYGSSEATHKMMIRGAAAQLSIQGVIGAFYVSINGSGRYGLMVDFQEVGKEKIQTIYL